MRTIVFWGLYWGCPFFSEITELRGTINFHRSKTNLPAKCVHKSCPVTEIQCTIHRNISKEKKTLSVPVLVGVATGRTRYVW